MLKYIAIGAMRAISPRIMLCKMERGFAATCFKEKTNYLSQTPETTTEKIKPPKIPAVEIRLEKLVSPSFVSRVIGLHILRWSQAFDKYPELKGLKRSNFLDTCKVLRTINWTAEDILSKPSILLLSGFTLESRYYALKECGMEPVSITQVIKYLTVIKKSIKDLKTQHYLPNDTNVLDSLCKSINIHLNLKDYQYNENIDIRQLRENVMNAYFRQRLEMTDDDISKIWRSYIRVRHKSFRSIQSVVDILLTDLKFSKERIVKNAFLLHADPENVRRILKEIPKIGNQDIYDVCYRRPKILMSNCDAILKTLKHVKSFGINEEAVTRCLEVLTLGPNTVLERLRDLNQIEEFRVLVTNPRVLRLVHYQNKARMRLEYLNKLQIFQYSLHILSCGSEAFAKFTRDGCDRTKGRDVVVYLSNLINRDGHEIRKLMSRHPNWCNIPSLHVKQVYEFLISKKFSNADIYQNIHLLLYPIERIVEKLSYLHGIKNLKNMNICNRNVSDLTNGEILKLVLYLIEFDYHFTGDGVWDDMHMQNTENFSNLLPDYPELVNKVYKFGMKPPNNIVNTQQQQPHPA